MTQTSKPSDTREQRRVTYILQEAHKADATFNTQPFAKWVEDIAIARPALTDAAHTWLAERRRCGLAPYGQQDSDRETRAERTENRRKSLEAAYTALGKAVKALQQAQAEGSTTESLIFSPLIRAVAEARDTTRHIDSARIADADDDR